MLEKVLIILAMSLLVTTNKYIPSFIKIFPQGNIGKVDFLKIKL